MTLLVTENMMYASMRFVVNHAQSHLQNIQAHGGTGLRVMEPSDDPAAASRGTLIDAGLQRLGGMAKASTYAQNQLSLADDALKSTQNLLSRVRELTVQATNATLAQESRADIAKEIQGISSSLLALANSQQDNNYIFAGYLCNTAPFAADGAYSGDGGLRQIEASPSLMVNVNIPGSQVFNVVGGENVLGDLQQLATNLLANDIGAIRSSLTSIDNCIDQVSTAQSSVGASLWQLVDAAGTRESTELSLKKDRAVRIELDLVKSYTEMMHAQQQFEAAVSQASIILRSIVDNSLLR